MKAFSRTEIVVAQRRAAKRGARIVRGTKRNAKLAKSGVVYAASAVAALVVGMWDAI